MTMTEFDGLSVSLGELWRLSDAETRSVSAENFSGDKGKGGMSTDGIAAQGPACELGRGWKVSPSVSVEPGATFPMADIKGSGAVQHIWLTVQRGFWRRAILRIYWDNQEQPSVECPVGDFFGCGWGEYAPLSSLAVCVNPGDSGSGFNCYWPMPFRRKCRVTMENLDTKGMRIYYQIDYSLTKVPKKAAYLHAQFRRINPLPYKDVYTIVDGVKGKGHYVGTYLAHGANSPGWWGEGEIKFYMDGDTDFPTLCGTGEEDYFCGAYGYETQNAEGKRVYTNFSTPYTGFHQIEFPKGDGPEVRRFGQYRWHIMDPIRFEKDLRVTIQSLGWQSEGRYLPLQDDLASVGFWYQAEPHQGFPDVLSREQLIIN